MTAADTFLTTAELAELLRTPESTLRYWRHIGKGPRSFKPGRRVLYARADYEAWIRAEQAETNARRAS